MKLLEYGKANSQGNLLAGAEIPAIPVKGWD